MQQLPWAVLVVQGDQVALRAAFVVERQAPLTVPASLVLVCQCSLCCLGRHMIWRTRYILAHALAPRRLSVYSLPPILAVLTIVPYVIRPTRALAGKRLSDMMIESLSAFKLSSS